MKRIFVAVILCSALSLRMVAAPPTAAPVLKFSIYAVVQKDSPLRIVGFKYDSDDLELVLANQTDRVVTGAVIAKRLTAPLGCAVVESTTGELSSGPELKELRINPRQKLAIRDSVAGLVLAAKYLKAAGVQVQTAVTEVDFADGTRWRPDPDPRLPTGHPMATFKPSLLVADAGMCSSPDSVIEALSSVNGTRSQSGATPPESSDATVEGEATPHIVFECTLEETSAICPKR